MGAMMSSNSDPPSPLDVLETMEESRLLTLPPEIRLLILKLLPPKVRQSCRMTCSVMAHEIDELLGATDKITLNNKLSKGALEFFGRSAWKSITIDRACNLIFENVIYQPKLLKQLTILTYGSITPAFGDNLLSQCLNLKKLTWEGVIFGGPLKLEPPSWFHNLVNLELDLSLSRWKEITIGETLSPEDQFISNQISLLRRIRSPVLDNTSLSLHTLMNEQYDHDLTVELFNFLKFHHKFRYLDIYINLSPSTRDGRSPPPPTPPNLSHISLPEKLEISDFLLLNSSRHSQRHWDRLLPSIRGLKNLTIWATEEVRYDWGVLERVIRGNSETLVTLDLRGVVRRPIDLQTLSLCKLLAVLKIHNSDMEEISPEIINFGPHLNFMKNLTTLTLTYLQISHADVMSLRHFRQLQNLAVWGIGFQTGINLESLRLIFHIRSLNTLLLHIESFSAADVDEFEALGSLVTSLDQFRVGNFINIEDGADGWWTLSTRRGAEVEVRWRYHREGSGLLQGI